MEEGRGGWGNGWRKEEEGGGMNGGRKRRMGEWREEGRRRWWDEWKEERRRKGGFHETMLKIFNTSLQSTKTRCEVEGCREKEVLRLIDFSIVA